MIPGLSGAGMIGGLGGASAAGSGGAGLAGARGLMPGEWDWMQNPMFAQALMGTGGMFANQPQGMGLQPPQLGPMPMGRTTPVQQMPAPQTPTPQQLPPWYRGMFSG